MIITQKLYKYRCAVDNVLQEYLIIAADTIDEADNVALSHYAEQEGNEGKHVRPVSITELDLSKV